MKKEIVTLGSWISVILGLIVIATPTVISRSEMQSEVWLLEKGDFPAGVYIPAGEYKTYTGSFLSGSILWCEFFPYPYGINFFVVDEANYDNFRAGQSVTYVKMLELGSEQTWLVFIPPPNKMLYFVFDNSIGMESGDTRITIEIIRFWGGYKSLLPSEAMYIGGILLVLGLSVVGYDAVTKRKVSSSLERRLRIFGAEKFVKIVTIIGLMVLFYSATLPWVGLMRLWQTAPAYGYISRDWLSYNLSTYFVNLQMTLEGLRVIYQVQGYPDIALGIAVALLTYLLAFLFGIIAFLCPKRRIKMLFFSALLSGLLCILTGVSWIYAIEAAKARPIWGPWMDIVMIGVGPYVAQIAGAIILLSCYLYRNYNL